MTPAARAQAAIELLDEFAARPAPLDRIVTGYFRRRRYAGAKDRTAISEMVYGVMRRRAELIWRCGDEASSRLLVAAHLQQTDDLDSRFDGSRYGPAALGEDERQVLARPAPTGAPPDWVLGNYPDWLEDELTRTFGNAKLTELQAYNERAPLDLRVNTLKADRDTVLAALAADDVVAEPGTWSPWALRLPTGTRIDQHPLYRDGTIEVQDEASQLVALLTAAEPGQMVADVCAGAGGKALALAATMAGSGEVHALDVDARRLARLEPRLVRAGAQNVVARPLDGLADPWFADMAQRFDRVLIDVPCSGTGTWRRAPDARWRLTPGELADYVAAQRDILRVSAPLVRPGGRLVYATCSFLRVENEDQVAAFQAEVDGFDLVPAGEVWRQVLSGPAPDDAPCLRLSPANHGTDGFFLAIFERRRGA